MTAAGNFPKTDGDIYYGKDANKTVGIYTSFGQFKLNVTGSASSNSYSGAMKEHLLKNDGAIDCYIKFDGTATTSDFLIPAGTTKLVLGSATSISAITASGTTTLYCLGVGD